MNNPNKKFKPPDYEPDYKPVINLQAPLIKKKPGLKLDYQLETPPAHVPFGNFKKPLFKDWMMDEENVDEPEQMVDVGVMLNRLFLPDQEDNPRVVEAKQSMLAIANDLLAQMQAAQQGVGLNKIDEIGADKHRQANNAVQTVVLLNERMVKETFSTSVPIAKIYTTDRPEIIIKQLTLKKENEVARLLIIKELTFQIYAYQISGECHIIVPRIYNIQFYKNEEDNLVCEFEMDFLNKWPNILTWIQDKEKNDKNGLLRFILDIKEKLLCLRAHGIFHNDTHPDNILFLPPDEGSDIPNIGIIDFGKAMCKNSLPSTTGLYVPDDDESEEDQIRDFIIWIKKQQKKGDMFNDKEYFGGKRKKTRKPRKTCRKSCRKTYKKSRKTCRKPYKKSYKNN